MIRQGSFWNAVRCRSPIYKPRGVDIHIPTTVGTAMHSSFRLVTPLEACSLVRCRIATYLACCTVTGRRPIAEHQITCCSLESAEPCFQKAARQRQRFAHHCSPTAIAQMAVEALDLRAGSPKIDPSRADADGCELDRLHQTSPEPQSTGVRFEADDPQGDTRPF